jgi:hypothetical protein
VLLIIFLEEPKRFQLSDIVTYSDLSSSVEHLDLSGSAIVSLPTRFQGTEGGGVEMPPLNPQKIPLPPVDFSWIS